MAVSFRVAGDWAELTADGTVTIPATPQAGDRMYLFARWKDFSIMATVANWTAALTPFADGSVSSGNGTGSVKVACWYRDWQSGDTNPTVDFSSSPTTASVVIVVMSKGAGEAWLTPVAVTAAMTNWTTSSQSVSASSTASVPGAGVVMGLIGIRDDSATMTRPTNGIDDASSAITWNGNYVEAPATHHSTTTGDDGSADLGYRLVTSGATGTLRMTGTISAAETGAALWIVQGIESNLTVNNALHSHAATNASLSQVHSITVQDAAHSQSAGSLTLTQVHSLITQNANHAHITASPILTQVHNLVIQGAAHAHSAGAITLAVTSYLITQNASHAHTAQTVTLAQDHFLAVVNTSHLHTAQSPNVRTYAIVWMDPGGDAVQAVGYFNTDVTSSGQFDFDNTQAVAGIGSWRFNSGADSDVAATIPVSLGPTGRVSVYFRYDSLPDKTITASEFFEDNAVYSGGGFADPANTNADDGFYATATPARNAGQGNKCSASPIDVPVGAVIDSVKIIYERKYDTDTSIGISRVKWILNGAEGPNHDNSDMPLTDTVVEVDITSDYGWTWQDFQPGALEVVNEARRGDTDIEHTQSWDYLKVEVVYHRPVAILQLRNADGLGFEIFINPRSSDAVLRLADGAGNSYDGITPVSPDSDHRISFAYVLRGANDVDVILYIDGLRELSMTNGSTGDFASLPIFHYGWLRSPGVDHVCWFDQLYIDDGEDMSDPGDMRNTAKLPDSVNENSWDTTGGSGAVAERPLSTASFKQHAASSAVRQTYTLQDAATGDVDISGNIIGGYMGWAWAKKGEGDDGDLPALIVNNTLRSIILTTSPKLFRFAITSSSYPSHAAGIGMRSNEESADTFMYECGTIVSYQGPDINPNRILAYHELPEGTVLDLVDDLRANPPDPPDNYELCFGSSESETAMAIVTVSSLEREDGAFQQRALLQLNGGYGGRTRILAGIEVRIHVEIIGGPVSVALWHRLNVD